MFTSSSSVLKAQCQIHPITAHFCPVAMAPQATPPPADASGGGGVEVETMSEGSYECTSPDDISLPPLAETPEVVHSDVEEGFSSHSFHIGHQSHQQPDLAGSGPAHGGTGPPPLTSLSLEDTSSVHTGAGCSLPSRTFCPAQSVAGKNEPLPHNQSCSRPQAASRTDSAGGDVVDDSLCPHADGRVPEKSGDTGSRQRSSSSWGDLLTPQMAPATNPGCCTDAEETEESRFPGTAPGFGSFPNSPDHDGPPCGTCLPASSACSTHERLTSSVTQQRLHEPGLAPSGPVAPQPTSLAQALPQQPNRHGAHPPPPPGLLTPEQEANICQPVTICEEIRLTPQIRGPPLPAPPTPPQVYSETLPQGQGSGSAPRCFTQPLSGASVMEGSPVTLEVEVSGEPEPRVAGCRDTPSLGGALACEHSSDGGDGWRPAEAPHVVADWPRLFGTLCVLLWLLFLLVL
ncbi:guanine nucleotide-binding protein G(s) subunit alpha isoforms XLas [Takifugu rubripes]|uniref:guanine nucleotide-binding protein G(s) subunit alpha isoforms XLas n=1 Tax=Takifugu rubripes TaxID=31033 RepID=UPI0011459BBB|nr:guanine nucleotide-binding protein G(s) subunit alpha isoforms XLas-like [Takifugu rubripes]